MDRIGTFVMRGSIGNIRGHDQHCDAPSRQRCLAGSDRLAPGLLRREDSIAKDAAALEDVSEVDLLDRLEPHVLPDNLSREENDRRAVAICLVETVDEMKAA